MTEEEIMSGPPEALEPQAQEPGPPAGPLPEPEMTSELAAQVRALMESILLVAERPVTAADFARWLSNGMTSTTCESLANELVAAYEARQGGVVIAQVAGGYQFRTPLAHAPVLRNMLNIKPAKLSPAALEILAVIAYRQPVTRPEIEDIRGVDCGGVLKTLLDRRLVRVLGKKDEPGRPMLYGTTKEFLEFFGLRALTDLPTLQEYFELTEESKAKFEQATGEPFATKPVAAALAMSWAETGIAAPIPDLEGESDILDELEDAIKNVSATGDAVVEAVGLKAPEEGAAAAETEPESDTAAPPSETNPKPE